MPPGLGKSVEIFFVANVDKWVKGLDRATAKTDEFGRALHNQKKLADTTFKAGAALVVSAAGMVAATVGPALKLEDAVSRVTALTKLQGKELDAMNAKLIAQAKDLSVELGASLDVISQAYIAATKEGIKPATKEFDEFTKKAVQLSDIMQTDVATTIGIADTVLDRFGLNLRDNSDALDILFRGARAGETDFQNFAETLSAAALSAGSLEIPLKQTAGAAALLTQHGLSGSRAGMALGQMLSRLAAASDDASDTLHRLGVEVIDAATGKVRDLSDIFTDLRGALLSLPLEERSRTLKELIGEGGFQRLGAVVMDTSVNFGEFFQTLESGKGIQESFNDHAKSTAHQIDEAKAAITAARAEIGSAFLPILADFASGVADVARELRPFIEEHKNAIAPITGTAVAVGLLGIAVGKAAITIRTMQLLLPGFAAAFGPVAVALGVVTAAIWAFAEANREVEKVSKEMVDALPKTASETADEIARLEAELFDLYKATEPNVSAIQWLEERIAALKTALAELPKPEEAGKAFDAMAAGSRSAAGAAKEQASAYDDVFEAYARIRSIEAEGKWKGMAEQEGRTGLEGPQMPETEGYLEQLDLVTGKALETSDLIGAAFYNAFNLEEPLQMFADNLTTVFDELVNSGKNVGKSFAQAIGLALMESVKMAVRAATMEIIAFKIKELSKAAMGAPLSFGATLAAIGPITVAAAAGLAALSAIGGKIAGFEQGGVIPKTGLILAHAGERVVNPAVNTARDMAAMMKGTPLAGAVAGAGGGSFYFHMPIYGPVSSELDMEKVMRKAADVFRTSSGG